MDSDVTEHRSAWSGTPADWYALIPAYPRWIAVDSTFGDGSLRRPTYYTRYRGRDYACAQDGLPGDASEAPSVTVYALDREPDGPYPGWAWHPIGREACPPDDDAVACLGRMRRRLPAIADAADVSRIST